MTLVTLFAVALLGATAFYARTMLTSDNMAAVISAVLVDLTNEDRKDEDLGTLTRNSVLDAAAQAKADDMAEKGYFAHNSPDGKTSWHWFREAGYSFSYAGENLAVDFDDSDDVEEAWMDSPTHRANILNGKFTEIGIATAVGTYKGQKTTFVVQMFGTPAKTTAAAPVVSVTEPTAAEDIAIGTTEVLGEAAGEPEQAVAAEKTEVAPAASIRNENVEAPPVVTQADAPSYASTLGHFAASPKMLLRTLYVLSALLLLALLVLVTRLELKRHHAPHVLAASFLIVMMTGLFVAADRYVFNSPTIGAGSDEPLG